jgi:hypothetical protein
VTDKSGYIERRPDGSFAVLKPDAQRASAVLPTQGAAIKRAVELGMTNPRVERVRETSVGKPDKWRGK